MSGGLASVGRTAGAQLAVGSKFCLVLPAFWHVAGLYPFADRGRLAPECASNSGDRAEVINEVFRCHVDTLGVPISFVNKCIGTPNAVWAIISR